jgi:hypothetical protein
MSLESQISDLIKSAITEAIAQSLEQFKSEVRQIIREEVQSAVNELRSEFPPKQIEVEGVEFPLQESTPAELNETEAPNSSAEEPVVEDVPLVRKPGHWDLVYGLNQLAGVNDEPVTPLTCFPRSLLGAMFALVALSSKLGSKYYPIAQQGFFQLSKKTNIDPTAFFEEYCLETGSDPDETAILFGFSMIGDRVAIPKIVAAAHFDWNQQFKLLEEIDSKAFRETQDFILGIDEID